MQIDLVHAPQAEQLLARAAELGQRPDEYTCSVQVQAALAQRSTRSAWNAVQSARAAGVLPDVVRAMDFLACLVLTPVQGSC